MKIHPKINYLLRSTVNYFELPICPNCGSDLYTFIHRKYIVTRLLKCQNCKLLYRVPKDKPGFNENFYQAEYKQADNITTNLPSITELEVLKQKRFNLSGKNADRIVDLLTCLFNGYSGLKLLDYGASWGYISYQLLNQGLDVQSYEISKPRAAYGNQNLNLAIKTDINQITSNNQIFFSSHVIEHHPSIPEMLKHAHQTTLNNENVYFMAYCPNGSVSRLKDDKIEYHKNWGLVHPYHISDEFYEHIFSYCPYFIDTFPYDLNLLANWDKISQIKGSVEGNELLIVARIKMKLK